MAFEAEKSALLHCGLWARHRVRMRELGKEGVKWETAFRKSFRELMPDWRAGDPLPDVPPPPATAQHVLEGRDCPEKVSIKWVADNLAFESPDVTKCPSALAWSMWWWAKDNETNKSKFWASIYTQIVPSKEQMEADARREDDGEVDLKLIERVASERRAAEKAVAERRARVAASASRSA